MLDAAHILSGPTSAVARRSRKGLSLCMIHHAPFDAKILGVAPDYVVHIRRDVKEEHDGPMLTHGLQEMDGQRILVPRAASLEPKKEYLESGTGVSGGVGPEGLAADCAPMVRLASFCLCPPAERRL